DLLVRETEQIRELRFDEGTPGTSPFREVSEVLNAFEDMKVGLRSFQKYLPMKLVRKLLQEHAEPTLGGELMELTIYFSDIAGFTPINERMQPMEMATRLGTYLASLTEIIEEHNGTVVQYVGDEVMAFWGAPQPVEDHARQAAIAALKCAERVKTLWGDEDVPVFQTRFGIHTARVAVGHFGSVDRLYYGAIGDGINLTSRLEGANKYYGTEIILTADTRSELGDEFLVRRLDRVAVKGKELPVTIYELVSPAAAATDATRGFVGQYEAALDEYIAGRFGAALRGFRAALAVRATDEPSRIMAGRCRELLDSPPPKGWNGVHVMTMK
ncbi:MAG: adenylate cyclase, partial [Myxococcota bacterium]